MRKRLFCIVLSVCMLCSSLVVRAEEPGEEHVETQGKNESDSTEKGTDTDLDATQGDGSVQAPEDSVIAEEADEDSGAALDEQPSVEEPEEVETPEPVSDIDVEAGSEPIPDMSPAPETVEAEDELAGTSTVNGNLIIDKRTELTENKVVNGDLIINDTLYFGNYKIEVHGDVIANGWVGMGTGILTVDGNYRLEASRLDVGSGRVDIGGDLRVQRLDAEGNFVTSNGGYLYMANDAGRLNIDGDYIMESSHMYHSCSKGTMTLKGDMIQLSAGENDHFKGSVANGFKLIMAGTGPQKISMASVASMLGNVRFDNQDITLEGCFGGKLESNLNAEVIGDTIKSSGIDLNGHNMTLPASLTVEDDGIHLNGGILTVQGNVTTSAWTYAHGAGSQLIVTGDYMQEAGRLDVGSGRVDVGGDFRLQKLDAEGNYTPSNGGHINMGNAAGRLNIDGDFIMESSDWRHALSNGTMTLKGNLIQLPVGDNDYFKGSAVNGFKLIMAGTGPQKISTASANSTMGNLQLDNQDVTVEGYLNAALASDGKIKVADGGILKVSDGLALNNHKLEVTGDMAAGKNVTMGGTNGYLIINGNYWQEAGDLEVGKGRVDISGNLRVQALDADSDNTVGSGAVTMKDAGGRLNVGGDYVMQSNRDSTFRNGTLSLKGNLFQISSNGGTGCFNTTSTDHNVILDGTGTQAIQFDNQKSKVGTLQLARARSNYTFNPDPCWMKLVAWPFADVAAKEGNWKYDNIKYVYDKGIMTGVKETEFQPDVPLTRAMFASVIYRMADEPSVAYKSIFSDVPAGKWYSDAVIWAYENGIVAGLGDGRYGINDNITREQMARMLMEFARVRGYGISERDDFSRFADASQVSRWAREYMSWAVGSGMISGSTKDGKYYMNPKGQATRAECATMLAQFIKKHE